MEGLGWCPAGGPRGRMGGAQQSAGLGACDSSALGVLAGLRAPGAWRMDQARAGFSSPEAPVSPRPSSHLSPRQTLAEGSPVPSWAWALDPGQLPRREEAEPLGGAGSQPPHWGSDGDPDGAAGPSRAWGETGWGAPLDSPGPPRGSRPGLPSSWRVRLGDGSGEHGPSQLTCPPLCLQVQVYQRRLLGPLHQPAEQPPGEPPAPTGPACTGGAGEAPRAGEAGPLRPLLGPPAVAAALANCTSLFCFVLFVFLLCYLCTFMAPAPTPTPACPRWSCLGVLLERCFSGSPGAVCACGAGVGACTVALGDPSRSDPCPPRLPCSLLESLPCPPRPPRAPLWPAPWPPPWSLKLVGAPLGPDTPSLHRPPRGPTPRPRPCRARPS